MPEWIEDDALPHTGQGGTPHTDPPLWGLGIKRAMAGGVAGVALMVGPVGLAKVAVPTTDGADVEAADDAGTLFASVNRNSPSTAEATQLKMNRTLAVQEVTVEDKPGAPTAEVTTTTSTTTTTTTTAPPDDGGDGGGGDDGGGDPDNGGSVGDPGSYATWDALAGCETGGDWSTNTGNGYYGGIQFSLPTWESVGGTGLPSENSREEQIYRGQILQERSGWGQWPSCSSQLGYR